MKDEDDIVKMPLGIPKMTQYIIDLRKKSVSSSIYCL